MNATQLLSSQLWIDRLGWTLLHFLWQGIAIAALYAAARRWAARSFGPNARYMLACVALAVMAAAPVFTWSLLQPAAPETIALSFTAPLSSTAQAMRSAPVWWSLAGAERAMPAQFLPWVVTAWLAGAVVFWMRLLGGWMYAEQLRSRQVRPAPREWQQSLDRLRTRIRVSRPVRLLVSSVAQVPAVIGWLRPVVLVPVGALAGLPPEQMEALLLHELAHIRRHDYLVHIAQSVVEALLFYHPAIWWISGHIRSEREHCCDDAAVSVHGDVLAYARALAEMESARPEHFHPAVAATGGSLAHRIARLLGHAGPAPRTVSGAGVTGAAILLAITAFAVFGQPGARPKFEVASIKPSAEQRFITVLPLPGRLTATAPLRVLMQNAYTVQPFQIVGGPDWIGSDRYEIDAKADGSANRAQMFVMLQSLLEDRFQLKIHHETRELPVYTLVAARGGLKLPTPKDGGCVAPVSNGVPEVPPAGSRMTPPGPGKLPPTQCGGVRVMLERTGARMEGGKVPMAEFVRMLSTVLDRPVIDKTGFNGLFDLKLEFLPDEISTALPPPPPGTQGPDSSPSILIALQEQLGLRLESAKGPVDVIVIDQVEKPSAN